MRLDYQKLAPAGMRAVGGVYAYVANCGLPKSLVDLVYLRCSQINGCAYCVDAHARDLAKEGVATDKMMLVSVWREAGDVFSDKERAALRWAEELTLVAQTAASDEAFQAAAAQFQPKELADLTIAIGLINVYNRVAIGFRRGPEGAAAH